MDFVPADTKIREKISNLPQFFVFGVFRGGLLLNACLSVLFCTFHTWRQKVRLIKKTGRGRLAAAQAFKSTGG